MSLGSGGGGGNGGGTEVPFSDDDDDARSANDTQATPPPKSRQHAAVTVRTQSATPLSSSATGVRCVDVPTRRSVSSSKGRSCKSVQYLGGIFILLKSRTFGQCTHTHTDTFRTFSTLIASPERHTYTPHSLTENYRHSTSAHCVVGAHRSIVLRVDWITRVCVVVLVYDNLSQKARISY